MSSTNLSNQDNRPWWTFGHVWLVISGPAIVVIAAVATFFVAAKGMDPIVDESYYQQGLKLSKPASPEQASLMPAMNARNHAATVAESQQHTSDALKPADQ
ncbi:FixH family protein [Curvibacter sp. CHRR-16]|uniref:FixH family protein n=1 Tax=Curvibacter sp. CHRR-16 TaxID=2835872 RepID=UPI001BDB6AFA|nr:FixH family protein [Curvibacter sp. CHRR-16]MBT0570665.1 FixH family protein [Curvibacter sp. CHRR-16]